MAKNNKKGRFASLFDTQRVGPGVKKEDMPKSLSFAFFFKLLGRNINNLLRFNLLYVFGNFPFLFALYALTGNLNTIPLARRLRCFRSCTAQCCCRTAWPLRR